MLRVYKHWESKMKPMSLKEFLEWTPAPLPPPPGATVVNEMPESWQGQNAGAAPCDYHDCDNEARLIVREDYSTADRIFGNFDGAVCLQHVPPCAGGQDPDSLWACGRPHYMKPIGEEDFTLIHSRPWGFE